MSFQDVFKQENIELVFNKDQSYNNYIAYTNDLFSHCLKNDEFSREWSLQFESGRYVIVIFQRYAVFENGELIYKNQDFLETVGKECRYSKPNYVIVLDEDHEYFINSWNRNLSSHILRSKEEPLQLLVYTDAEKAMKEAQRYSLNNHRSAVMEWFEDYDMY